MTMQWFSIDHEAEANVRDALAAAGVASRFHERIVTLLRTESPSSDTTRAIWASVSRERFAAAQFDAARTRVDGNAKLAKWLEPVKTHPLIVEALAA